MKKTIAGIVILSMLCVSMSSFSVSKTIDTNVDNVKVYAGNYEATQAATTQIANTAQKYLALDEGHFTPYLAKEEKVQLPWIGKQNKGDFFEWYVKLVYNGEEFLQEVNMDIEHFKQMLESYMKHPEYGKIYNFNIDSDPENDIQVKIGFYWSIIMYPNGDEQKSLETRFQVRQLPSGNYIEEGDGDLEVWSELHVNYGLIKDPPTSRSTDKELFNSRILQFFNKFITRFENSRLSDRPLFKLFEKILSLKTKSNEDTSNDPQTTPIGTLDSDDDYISIGAGYQSPQGEQIPLYAEKRFAFAKGIDWKSGSIFKPTIFQHMMSPGNNVVGDDKMVKLFGFRAHQASSDQDMFDVAFAVEFEPAVNLKTKYIPADGYVYYFLNVPKGFDNFGGWTPRNTETKMTFTADVEIGNAITVPKLSLILDEINSEIAASSTKWFSFDLLGIQGFD